MKESGEDNEFQTESQQHNPDSIFGHFHCIQPASGGASVQVWTYRPPPPPAAHYGKNDIIGKYVERLMSFGEKVENGTGATRTSERITEAFLAENGF